MTNKEAMQMALDALGCIYSPLHVREINKVGEAMAALRARLAQGEQEPVAWQAHYIDRDGKQAIFTTSVYELAVENDMNGKPVPLYRAPVAASDTTPEPVAETEELQHEEQKPVAFIRGSGKAMLETSGYATVYASEGMSNHSTPLYTAPPKREWKGLTDEEYCQLWDAHIVPVFGKNGINPIVFARAIEAKLKEKNT